MNKKTDLRSGKLKDFSLHQLSCGGNRWLSLTGLSPTSTLMFLHPSKQTTDCRIMTKQMWEQLLNLPIVYQRVLRRSRGIINNSSPAFLHKQVNFITWIAKKVDSCCSQQKSGFKRCIHFSMLMSSWNMEIFMFAAIVSMQTNQNFTHVWDVLHHTSLFKWRRYNTRHSNRFYPTPFGRQLRAFLKLQRSQQFYFHASESDLMNANQPDF